jgi:hypothetical protein
MSTKISSLVGRVALLGLSLAYLLATPLPASAQQQSPPLAEVARKEAERRKGIKDTKKVITTKDLPESARKPASGSSGASSDPSHGHAPAPAAAAAPAGGQKPPDAIETAQKDEAFWRGRINTAREAVRRNEAFLAALQSQINGLTTDFVNRDDPYQRAQIGEKRQQALAEMERVKAEIENGRKQIADIEEEARKAGVPPGYLR